MTRYFIVLFLLFILLAANVNGQTQQDTIYTYYSKTPVIVDGSDTDACWAKAEWHAIDQVWIPFNDVMDDGDFEGKYKVSWDAFYLYILVEIKDNILSDDHSNPTDNYWNDDCVEIFIDEDRSKGIHQTNNNAFAYHTSVFYDVIDNGLNLRNNMQTRMDTIADKTYLWEFAVKMYNKNFNYSNAEASRVKLIPNKLMGFSIAYCDNDETTSRENFIGSMIMPEAHANDNYITADYFGSMLLVDPENQWVSYSYIKEQVKRFSLFPNPVEDEIQVFSSEKITSEVTVEILSVQGKIIKQMSFNNQHQSIKIGDLSNGLYLVRFTAGSYSQSEQINKH